MPDTGERREIAQRVNAKEAETIQESKMLVSKTKQISDNHDLKKLRQRSRSTNGRSRQKGKETQS